MKRILSLAIVLTTFWGCSHNPNDSADTIYINGKIYTVNEAQPWAEAVAIKDGKFLKVGSNAKVQAFLRQ